MVPALQWKSARVLPAASLRLLYDVSHNTCKEEEHTVNGRPRTVYVHRKGATRAWGPGHPGLPEALRAAGQPVLIGGSMGTCSYVLVGTAKGMDEVVDAAEQAGLSKRVARLVPMVTIKG